MSISALFNRPLSLFFPSLAWVKLCSLSIFLQILKLKELEENRQSPQTNCQLVAVREC